MKISGFAAHAPTQSNFNRLIKAVVDPQPKQFVLNSKRHIHGSVILTPVNTFNSDDTKK